MLAILTCACFLGEMMIKQYKSRYSNALYLLLCGTYYVLDFALQIFVRVLLDWGVLPQSFSLLSRSLSEELFVAEGPQELAARLVANDEAAA